MIKMKSQSLSQIQDKLNRIKEESNQLQERDQERDSALHAKLKQIAEDYANQTSADYASLGRVHLELPKEEVERWKNYGGIVANLDSLCGEASRLVKKRGYYAERLLKRLYGTFGTSDEQNSINADRWGFDEYYKSEKCHNRWLQRMHPADPAGLLDYQIFSSIDSKDVDYKEQKELFENRKMTKEQFENLLLRATTHPFHPSRKVNHDNLEIAIEEHKNTPYNALYCPRKQKYEVQELTEEEWEKKKEELWGDGTEPISEPIKSNSMISRIKRFVMTSKSPHDQEDGSYKTKFKGDD